MRGGLALSAGKSCRASAVLLGKEVPDTVTLRVYAIPGKTEVFAENALEIERGTHDRTVVRWVFDAPGDLDPTLEYRAMIEAVQGSRNFIVGDGIPVGVILPVVPPPGEVV